MGAAKYTISRRKHNPQALTPFPVETPTLPPSLLAGQPGLLLGHAAGNLPPAPSPSQMPTAAGVLAPFHPQSTPQAASTHCYHSQWANPSPHTVPRQPRAVLLPRGSSWTSGARALSPPLPPPSPLSARRPAGGMDRGEGSKGKDAQPAGETAGSGRGAGEAVAAAPAALTSRWHRAGIAGSRGARGPQASCSDRGSALQLPGRGWPGAAAARRPHRLLHAALGDPPPTPCGAGTLSGAGPLNRYPQDLAFP